MTYHKREKHNKFNIAFQPLQLGGFMISLFKNLLNFFQIDRKNNTPNVNKFKVVVLYFEEEVTQI